jgi:flavodoxin
MIKACDIIIQDEVVTKNCTKHFALLYERRGLIMKTLIIYASHHHGNTEKLVKHMAENYDIELFNAEKEDKVDYDGYDLIGFASGMDFGKFYPQVTDLAEKLPAGKKVFALYTCGMDSSNYGRQIEEIAAHTDCKYLGKFGCKGYDTYGPWKLIGGINKAHPSESEMADACAFYESISK